MVMLYLPSSITKTALLKQTLVLSPITPPWKTSLTSTPLLLPMLMTLRVLYYQVWSLKEYLSFFLILNYCWYWIFNSDEMIVPFSHLLDRHKSVRKIGAQRRSHFWHHICDAKPCWKDEENFGSPLPTNYHTRPAQFHKLWPHWLC